MSQVWGLLSKIKDLRDSGVTGASMMWSWLRRRVQPLQKREHFGYEYLAEGDPSRLSGDELLEADALRMLRRAVHGMEAVPFVPKLFSIARPPKPVSSSVFSVEYFLDAFWQPRCHLTSLLLIYCRGMSNFIGVTLLSPMLLVRII